MGMLSYGQRSKCADLLEVMDNCNIQRLKYESDCSARRLLLKTVEGMETRPTTDRIKETLFNMLQNDLYGARFLDLFAGSGAIGIEALSRGAKEAVFVDKGDGQISCIRENLKTTHLEEKARVMSGDVTEAVRKLDRDGTSEKSP